MCFPGCVKGPVACSHRKVTEGTVPLTQVKYTVIGRCGHFPMSHVRDIRDPSPISLFNQRFLRIFEYFRRTIRRYDLTPTYTQNFLDEMTALSQL